MPRGGARPGAGRKKQERPTNANVASKVLAQARAERLWLSMIELEKKRLGIGLDGQLLELKPRKKKTLDENGAEVFDDAEQQGAIDGPDYQGKFSIIPLVNLLRYLEDRAYGRPVDTVNHLHDKPLEVNATLTLGEGMRLAMEKAEQRVRNRR